MKSVFLRTLSSVTLRGDGVAERFVERFGEWPEGRFPRLQLAVDSKSEPIVCCDNWVAIHKYVKEKGELLAWHCIPLKFINCSEFRFGTDDVTCLFFRFCVGDVEDWGPYRQRIVLISSSGDHALKRLNVSENNGATDKFSIHLRPTLLSANGGEQKRLLSDFLSDSENVAALANESSLLTPSWSEHRDENEPFRLTLLNQAQSNYKDQPIDSVPLVLRLRSLDESGLFGHSAQNEVQISLSEPPETGFYEPEIKICCTAQKIGTYQRVYAEELGHSPEVQSDVYQSLRTDLGQLVGSTKLSFNELQGNNVPQLAPPGDNPIGSKDPRIDLFMKIVNLASENQKDEIRSKLGGEADGEIDPNQVTPRLVAEFFPPPARRFASSRLYDVWRTQVWGRTFVDHIEVWNFLFFAEEWNPRTSFPAWGFADWNEADSYWQVREPANQEASPAADVAMSIALLSPYGTKIHMPGTKDFILDGEHSVLDGDHVLT